MEGKILKKYKVDGTGSGFITIDAGVLAPASYYYSLMIDQVVVDTKRMVIIE